MNKLRMWDPQYFGCAMDLAQHIKEKINPLKAMDLGI